MQSNVYYSGRQRQRLNWDGLRRSLTLRLNGLKHWVKWLMTNLVAFVIALLYGTVKFLSSLDHSPAILDLSNACSPEESGFIPPQEFQWNAVQVPADVTWKSHPLTVNEESTLVPKLLHVLFLDLRQGSRMLERRIYRIIYKPHISNFCEKTHRQAGRQMSGPCKHRVWSSEKLHNLTSGPEVIGVFGQAICCLLPKNARSSTVHRRTGRNTGGHDQGARNPDYRLAGRAKMCQSYPLDLGKSTSSTKCAASSICCRAHGHQPALSWASTSPSRFAPEVFE